jgi:hypothetical protein
MIVSRWRKLRVLRFSRSIALSSLCQKVVRSLWHKGLTLGLSLLLFVGWCGLTAPWAQAGLNDDRFDGNIFALYAGNGSLIPPKVNLEQSLAQQDKPTLLVLYLEDSSDCKLYSSTVSKLQSFYGQVANFVPINADSIVPKAKYAPTESGYYYKGLVPQTILFDRTGKIRLDRPGQVPFEAVDDVFRDLFDLLPRSESVELKRRSFNEFSAEMTK